MISGFYQMKYLLKNNRDGAASVYRTTVEASQDERNIYFNFVAEHSNYYCPYHNYNDIHSCGDAVEILIGIDPARKTYYELEVNPDNSKMLAKMTVTELDGDGAAKLNIEFVDEKDCFFYFKHCQNVRWLHCLHCHRQSRTKHARRTNLFQCLSSGNRRGRDGKAPVCTKPDNVR